MARCLARHSRVAVALQECSSKLSNMKRPLRIPDIQAKKYRGEKITMLTAYDAWMSRMMAELARLTCCWWAIRSG